VASDDGARDSGGEARGDVGSPDSDAESASDVTDAAEEGSSDSESGVSPYDASDRVVEDVIVEDVIIDAPTERGVPEGSPGCPVAEPVNGDPCSDPGITCNYGPVPRAGAICTCEASSREWHCLLI
jgi:hypothetical protein